MKRIRAMAVRMVLALALSAAASRPAWAQDPIHKAGRGLVNVLTGWIELPKQLHLGGQEENPMAGIAGGLLKGAGLGLLRVGVGLYEIVTFPIPYPRHFASPYEQMELRDYAWE